MESMDEIYGRHSKMIYYVLLSKVNNPDLAEELTQETFYQALKSFLTFEGRSSVSTWLCGISNHVFKAYWESVISGYRGNYGEKRELGKSEFLSWKRKNR